MAMAVLSARMPGMISTRDIVPRQRVNPGAPRRCGTPREGQRLQKQRLQKQRLQKQRLQKRAYKKRRLQVQAAGVACGDRVHLEAVQAHVAG
jgi:hypothetical protein